MKTKNIVFQLVSMSFQSMMYSFLSFVSGKTSVASSKKSLSKALLLALVGVLVLTIIFFFTVMFFIFGFMVKEMQGADWLFPTIALLVSLGFSMMGSVLASQSYLFESHDNELLVSMPIKPSQILLSRFIVFYSLNLIYSMIIFIPALIAFAFVMGFKIIGLLAFVLVMIISPLLSTAVCSFIGYLIWLIASKLPNKKLFTTLIGFSLSAVMIILSMNLKGVGQYLFNNSELAQQFFIKYFAPFYWFGVSVTDNNFLYSLPIILIGILFSILSFAFILTKFAEILCTKSAGYKKKYIQKPMKVQSPMVTLVKKEVSYFLSIPSYILNGSFGTVASIIMGIYMLVQRNSFSAGIVNIEGIGLVDLTSVVPIGLMISLTLFASMNDATAPSISLEAKTLWIIKTMPIDCMYIFIAKSLVSLIITLPGIIFLTTSATIVYSLGAFDILFLLIIPSVAAVFSGFLGVCVNLMLPRFDWSSEIIVIKQSGSVIITIIASIILSIIPMTVCAGIAILFPQFPKLLLYLVCMVYFLILVVAEIIFLKKKGKILFENL